MKTLTLKKYSLLLAFLFAFTLASSAQQKNLTIQDALVNNRSTLAPETLKGLQFINGSDDYVYVTKLNGTDTWVSSNYKTNAIKPLLTLSDLNKILAKDKYDTFKTLPPVKFNNDNFVLSMKGGRYQYNTNSKTIRLLMDKDISAKQNLEESGAGYFAYLQDDNLYVGRAGSAVKLTNDGSADIVYASTVHQSEFGIIKGTYWSNNGKSLAFYRMDQTMIPNYPIIDWSVIPAKVVNVKYPMAGDSSHHVTVGVYNVEANKMVYLKTGLPAEQYLTNIAWGPDDKSIFIAIVNREQNHMWLRQYDATTGDYLKTLFEEEDAKYTEPLVPMLFVKNNPTQFIWQSRRDGWNQLYLYDVSGKLLKQLTKGDWEVTEVKGFDEKGENLFYMSTAVSPLTKNLYNVNIKTGKSTRITNAAGNHSALISDDGKFVLDNYSTPKEPRTIALIDTKTGKEKTIFQARNPLAGYALGEMNLFTIKAVSGDDLYCRIFKPVNFDSTKKYPVIVYWYGGPHAQVITNSWNGGASDYWFQYMAERGYVVFSLDTRGSSNRGKAFEQTIFRHAGQVQMQDMEKGVEYLKTLPYVNGEKMGLFGWSYGGFMTTDFVLNHAGTFKAAVAGGPVMDWREYEIMYGERYMDRPQENPEGYKATNLILQASKLKDKLLIIHGLQDPVVLQQHSVRFVKACVDAGVQVDYMIYPGHEHNVLGKDRAHLFQKITDYFNEYLK